MIAICGIAGYSIGDDVARGLGDGVVEQIVRDNVMFNRHRGIHAVGWYAQYDEPMGQKQVQTIYWKQEGDPKELDTFPDGKPVVLACHTRAATNGDPEDNENNHPLMVGNAIIVHNGGVRNHEQLKAALDLKMGRKVVWPKVDSVVLAGGLNYAAKDWSKKSVDAYTRFLDVDVNGGVAMAGSLMSHPGVQLLARTTSSPMIVAKHKELPVVLWASEQDAVFKMIENFSMSHDDFDVRKLEFRKLLVVDHGRVVQARDFSTLVKSKTWRSTPYSGYALQIKNAHWLTNKMLAPSMFQAEEQHYAVRPITLDELYQQDADVDVIAAALEATDVYVASPNPDKIVKVNSRFYLTYGEEFPLTEVVLSAYGSMLDVLYHRDLESAIQPRWSSEEEPVEEGLDGPGFYGPPIAYSEPRELFAVTDKNSRRILPFGTPKVDACVVEAGKEEVRAEDYVIIVPDTPYTILMDADCVEHKKKLSEHTYKEAVGCDKFRFELMQTASIAGNISELREEYVQDLTLVYEGMSTDYSCEPGQHQWETITIQKFAATRNQVSDFPVEDMCTVCGSKRSVGANHWMIDTEAWFPETVRLSEATKNATAHWWNKENEPERVWF